MLLVINKPEEGRLNFRKKFYNCGIGTYACPFKSAYPLLKEYEFDAIILTESTKFKRVHLLCRDLKKEFPHIPLIVIASNESEQELDKIIKYVDNIILPHASFSRIMEIIFEYIRAFSKKDVTDMMAESVRIVHYKKCVYVGGVLFNATKTEYSILRHLVSTHPNGAKACDIVRFCFNPSHKVTESNVSSFIHEINKKSNKIFGRKLVDMVGRLYYKISF